MNKDIFIKIKLSLPKDSDEEFTEEDIAEIRQDYEQQFATIKNLKTEFEICLEDKDSKQISELKAENQRLSEINLYNKDLAEQTLKQLKEQENVCELLHKTVAELSKMVTKASNKATEQVCENLRRRLRDLRNLEISAVRENREFQFETEEARLEWIKVKTESARVYDFVIKLLDQIEKKGEENVER